jgi:predicted NUDIX family NTP pyrophosphohydrolase
MSDCLPVGEPNPFGSIKKQSAGILLFRGSHSEIEVFVVDPRRTVLDEKGRGSWSIPKGKYSDDEDALRAANREFEEETSVTVDGDFISLGEVKQAGGKVVKTWALEHDLNPAKVKSNSFGLECHRGRERFRNFPKWILELGFRWR